MTGFICLDKQEDITSFYAVRVVRGITREKKAGHGGTLDPMATGVLPIALGGATGFLPYLENHNKAYEAEIKLGITTDTLDITGKILSERVANVTRKDIENVLEGFKGKISQLPPMYSALKKDGVRLYDLARQGIEIEREKREIEIFGISLLSFDEKEQRFSISVSCSEGTYIRSLASDIGDTLGTGACMTRLRRTEASGFTLSDCVSVKELEQMKEKGDFSRAIKKVKDVFGYEKITVSQAQSKRFSNGGELDTKRLHFATMPSTFYRVFSAAGEFLGLGQTDEKGESLLVKRVYRE